MPNTYTQIHIQCVMAVKSRHALIGPSWKEQLHKYITGIVQNQGHKLIAINSMPDHLHLFIGFRPNQSLSDLMRIVKSDHLNGLINNNLIRRNLIGRKVMGFLLFTFAYKSGE